MRILAVDDELIALKNMELKLKECAPRAEYVPFQSAEEALEWLKQNEANVALLDIHMADMDGIELAKHVRELCPTCAIIFVTGYSEYAIEAFAMKVNGYLLKPVDVDSLRKELDYIYRDNQLTTHESDRLKIQCFGNFEAFYDGRPLSFSRSKSKELLAYLVDRRGAAATMAEVAGILWQDGKYDNSRNNQIHTYLHDLNKTLASIGDDGKEIIIKSRNSVAIDTSKIDCDYYRFLNGDINAINTYSGEYMSQYWWAEFTTGTISGQMSALE